MTLLTHKQAMAAVQLGCCVAMGTHEDIIGHAFEARGRALGECPPADLRTYPGPEDFVYVEALSSDGLAFLELINDGFIRLSGRWD